MLKRFILWDYPRASWQYDVMVGIILVFIFLTPREWFRDQPRIPQTSNIAMLPSEHGSTVFWIDLQLLDGIPEGQRASKATEVLRTASGNTRLEISQVQPVWNSENELLGYMAFARP
ncbi:MAG TPA: hypothetical protein VN442_14680 [Bryobacteraceae bacterium]|nr:hypothetical protein [Bryobacteraceae bacterium]